MPQPLPSVKYFLDESLLQLYFCLRPPTVLAQLEDLHDLRLDNEDVCVYSNSRNDVPGVAQR